MNFNRTAYEKALYNGELPEWIMKRYAWAGGIRIYIESLEKQIAKLTA